MSPSNCQVLRRGGGGGGGEGIVLYAITTAMANRQRWNNSGETFAGLSVSSKGASW